MLAPRLQSAARLLMATLALAATAFALAAAAPAEAGGLRNCVDISGRQFNHVGCYENVWADGAEYRMTFSNTGFDGATPKALDPFYLVAPQTDAPQGYPPNTFRHDHVVRSVPPGNQGTYAVRLQGFFVFCSGTGITTGECVPDWISIGGDPLPFAKSANGQRLTSTESIEAAAAAGLVTPLNLGPGAVIVGAISGK